MITQQQIQQKLIESIKLSGLTQTQLARRLGVSSATVSYYLSGDKMPALDTFANICAVLDIDANELLCVFKDMSR